MSQFTGLLSARGLGSIQNLGVVAADVTPNAVDWSNGFCVSSPCYSGTETITGINTTITIKISWSSNDGNLHYIKNGGSPVLLANNNETFTVVNNDTVQFQYVGSGGGVNFDVINQSDGDTLLDSIYIFLDI